MAKRRDRVETEVESLQKQVRELKAENRSLLKRLKKVDRDYAEELEKINKNAMEEQDSVRRSKSGNSQCGHCGKGFIVIVDVAGRKFASCSTCDYRSGTKIS